MSLDTHHRLISVFLSLCPLSRGLFDPIPSHLISSCTFPPLCVVLSCAILSGPVMYCPVPSCAVLGCPVLSCAVLSCRVGSPLLQCTPNYTLARSLARSFAPPTPQNHSASPTSQADCEVYADVWPGERGVRPTTALLPFQLPACHERRVFFQRSFPPLSLSLSLSLSPSRPFVVRSPRTPASSTHKRGSH
ncbi:unnamed protein product [Protopolystoma xenopodis]|uniref:Uncharacterized protein n=1 Tax=Protopolystoma xenopodis TaxID=117903 RepID=A0A448WY63_9PLAT|nr:unnamed protein product [Protopolystoma xenopodis]